MHQDAYYYRLLSVHGIKTAIFCITHYGGRPTPPGFQVPLHLVMCATRIGTYYFSNTVIMRPVDQYYSTTGPLTAL